MHCDMCVTVSGIETVQVNPGTHRLGSVTDPSSSVIGVLADGGGPTPSGA